MPDVTTPAWDLFDPDECAARGAALLDFARPGWHRGINPVSLRMADNFNCVLGQLSNPDSVDPYEDVARDIGILAMNHETGQWVAAHFGFTVPPGWRWDTRKRDEQWTELDRAWRALIAQRADTEDASSDG